MPFNAPASGSNYGGGMNVIGGPLQAPALQQYQAAGMSDTANQLKLGQQAISGQLQTGAQQIAGQQQLQQLKTQGALQTGAQSGDIQKALQASQQAFTGAQHAEDIGQAQWLEKAQEAAAQALQSGALGEDWQKAQLQASVQLAPLQFAEQKFGQVFPFFQQQFSGLAGGAGGGGMGGMGGGYTGGMVGSTGGFGGGGFGGGGFGGGGGAGAGGAPSMVYTPQQVQQQVNAQRAQNDQQTAAGQARVQQQLSGQGFGANSPLAQALSGQLGMQNMATNSDTERNIRMGAAQQNAQQATQAAQIAAGLQQTGMQTGAQMAGAQLQAQTAQQQIAASRYNALLSALSGII